MRFYDDQERRLYGPSSDVQAQATAAERTSKTERAMTDTSADLSAPLTEPAPPSRLFLTLHGVPRHYPPANGETAYIRDPQGAWRPWNSDLLYEIEAECVRLHDAFAAALFGDIRFYH